jgi:hypothetical protein
MGGRIERLLLRGLVMLEWRVLVRDREARRVISRVARGKY